MKQRDKIEEKLKTLPKYKMDTERKRRNYYALKRPEKGSKSKYVAYPLTIFTFLVMIFAGYTLLFESKETTTTFNDEEYTKMQMYFDGVTPIYSNSNIPDSVGVPEEYHKGVALGFLYNASIFYTPQGEKVNPLEINTNINAYFDYEEEDIDTSSAQSRLLADTKPTWLYLNAAASYIDDKSISKKLRDLSEKINEISASKSFQHNYSVYREVSRKTSEIVIETTQVTENSTVYEGESKNWFVRLQPLDGDDYLLYLSDKSLENNNDNSISEVSISDFKPKFLIEFKLQGKVKYIYGENLSENMAELEEVDLEIKSKGNEETLTLNKLTKVNISP
ncbi:hypothetical protein [Halobacillus karajensis]|uniref:Uncharacterized protein n=1 Tax=Halobacillus karajensis TaxID=195088 RepID=A0A059NXT0_9BACI|nr:hypothetical protein [Halobacillus karajensis]CDQ20332.1 hypothetical protein BN982_02661 [Halobacillus karajensis]CDQ23600.1 hypothetical protein BN983_01846 [Halobacillus karajensis]CDQ27079.1 hypothetical protein BN981_01328 [Halobacillus karajensis]